MIFTPKQYMVVTENQHSKLCVLHEAAECPRCKRAVRLIALRADRWSCVSCDRVHSPKAPPGGSS